MLTDKANGHSPEPDEIRFETYSNYLACIQGYMIESYGDWNQYAARCVVETARVQPRPNLDLSRIERLMKLAWNTEYLLSSGQTEPEMVRINNQWTPIQCYYAVYSAAEALGYALDGQKSDGHSKTLRKMTAYFVKSAPTPWNLAYSGPHGKDKRQARPLNFPPDFKIAHNLQRRGVQPVGLIARCLKAEHSHRIDEKYGFQPKAGRQPRSSIDPR